MATLLHLDSSLLPDGISVSRDVADRFRKEWEAQLPTSRVIYRDLSAAPVPHAEFAGVSAAFTSPEDRTPDQAAAFALREALATELEEADAVLIAAPMYNYTISSTLKAWLDHVIIRVGHSARHNRRRERQPSWSPAAAVRSPREPRKRVGTSSRTIWRRCSVNCSVSTWTSSSLN